MPPTAPIPGQAPTRQRYWVLFFAVCLAVITYIDRVAISQAAPYMREELGLSAEEMGWAFSAFFWAYALFEIPTGWMGDRWGPRRVLMRVVVWWSVFTAATGWVRGWTSLLLTRTLFGAGEAGCFPNVTKAFSVWLPRSEQVRAQGILWLSARWGGAFTPLLVAFLMQYLSWRHCFEIFGCLGIVWAVFFFLWFRDNPRDRKEVNAAELALLPRPEEVTLGHGKIPWRKFLLSGSVWLLWLQYVCLNFGAVFYITWLPTYLKEARGLPLTQGALLAGIPLFFGGLGSLFCGFLSSTIVGRIGSVRIARRLLATVGFWGAASCLAFSTRIENPILALLAMGAASFSNDLVMPPSWGACMDIGGRFTGTLSGSMNMMGNFGGALASLVIGYILGATHNWDLALYVSAAAYFLGAFCWWLLDSTTPLEQVSPSHPDMQLADQA